MGNLPILEELKLLNGDPCLFVMAEGNMLAVRAQERITNHESHAKDVLRRYGFGTKSLERVNMKTASE